MVIKTNTQRKHLITKLQNECCDYNGREVNYHESARIFNELGLLLWESKSPHKMELIHSAYLLNAARIRQPLKQKYQNDMEDLCKHVLRCANATRTDVSLPQISETVAVAVVEMRKNVNSLLQKIPKFKHKHLKDEYNLSMEKKYLKAVQDMQIITFAYYHNVMAIISHRCKEILGDPPCEYALVGMGSMASTQMTPYSTFNYMILLKDYCKSKQKRRRFGRNVKEYFRWYSVLFHIIVINLQESLLPMAFIEYLSQLTKKKEWIFKEFANEGISIGKMMPHTCHFVLENTEKLPKEQWKTELIKPVNEMVKFLQKAKNFQSNYVSDKFLSETCFIDGSGEVYSDFCDKIESSKLPTQCNSKLNEKIGQLELVNNFDLNSNLRKLMHDSISKELIINDLPVLVAALGSTFGINEGAPFEIIQQLNWRGEINLKNAHSILYALAVGYHAQLIIAYEKQTHSQFNCFWNETKIDIPVPEQVMRNIFTKSCLIKSFLTTVHVQMMLIDVIKRGTFQRPTKNWSHILVLCFLELEKKVSGVSSIEEKENQTTFTEKDVEVLHYLVKHQTNVSSELSIWKSIVNLISYRFGWNIKIPLLKRIESLTNLCTYRTNLNLVGLLLRMVCTDLLRIILIQILDKDISLTVITFLIFFSFLAYTLSLF